MHQAPDAVARVSMWTPVRVAEVDLDGPIADIDCTARDRTSYTSAWILVRRGRQAVGDLRLNARDGRISAKALGDAVAATLAPLPPSLEPVDTALLPRVSVVVPSAMTRIAELQDSVACLTALDYPDFEVIVVDNHRGAPVNINLPGARVVREPQPGISAARNAGVAVADGDIVAFTDDDVRVDSQWLRALAERFVREPDLAGITGLVAPYELESDGQLGFEKYFGLDVHREYSPLRFERTGMFTVTRTNLHSGERRVSSLYKLGELGVGANIAFRAAALREAGGFDTALGAGTLSQAGEETALMVGLLMKGRALAYEPNAVVWHKHRTSLDELERQIRGYGIGFTARLLALMLGNPAHVVGLAALVVRRLMPLRDRNATGQGGGEDDRAEGGEEVYLLQLRRIELRATAAGPLRYLRARGARRRWGGVHNAVAASGRDSQ